MEGTKLSELFNRRAVPNAEYYRILVDCRDLMAHRLLVSFASMMDRLVDQLFERASRSGFQSESTLLLDTRSAVQANRAYIVSSFEKGLRAHIDRRLRGEVEDPSAAPAAEHRLKLVDDSEVEEVIATSNFVRSLADTCHDELAALNARIGFLLGERQLQTAGNPFGPYALGRTFSEAWDGVDIPRQGKVIVLKMLDSGVVGDVNSIYVDLNRHLVNLNVLPRLSQSQLMRSANVRALGGDGREGRDEYEGPEAAAQALSDQAQARQDGDLFAMLSDLFVRQRAGRAAGRGLPGVGGDSAAPNPWSRFGIGAEAVLSQAAGLAGGRSGVLVDPRVILALTQLQQASGDGSVMLQGMGGATPLTFDQNMLRSLTPQALGNNVDATGAITIELVAMLFDFVSAEPQLPEGIKALIFRLQIPVLKAAMLDKEFFSRRTHPARMLTNRYAEAGIAWRVEQGITDPLYRKIEEGIARIQSEFTDQLGLFDEVLKDLESFLREEETSAERLIQASANDIASRERQEVAHIVAEAELDRRINSAQPPQFLADFLRDQWRDVLIRAYLESGEEGDLWRAVLVDLDNLLWSVQPKWRAADRKDLVRRLPGLLVSLRDRLVGVEWNSDAREVFMSELVETHARAVTATSAPPEPSPEGPMPLAAALGDEQADQATGPGDGDESDQYHALAEKMVRGNWVEFTEESGILVFAKLSWVSPLRGKYLFTHRNGLKAFSLTREELAQRFREDSASPVESEPLLDRAFSDVMSRLSAQVGA